MSDERVVDKLKKKIDDLRLDVSVLNENAVYPPLKKVLMGFADVLEGIVDKIDDLEDDVAEIIAEQDEVEEELREIEEGVEEEIVEDIIALDE